MILTLVFAFLLVLANGAFVAMEFSLLASSRHDIEERAAQGSPRAADAVRATQDLSMQLAGAQLGVTAISLLLGSFAEPAVSHIVESALGPE